MIARAFILMIAVIGLTTNMGVASANTWQIDKSHSRVGFKVTHLGINTVHGSFKKFDAKIEADDAGKLTKVSATVNVASVDTGVDGRDEHLRAPDVFNAANYPKMSVVVDRVNWTGKRFSGTASLTIKDTTKKVAFKGKLTGVKRVENKGKNETRVGYQVTATVNRKAFGLKFGAFSEGLSMVGEKVDIVLDVEIVRSE